MRKTMQLVFSILLMGIFINCNNHTSEDRTPSKKDRDMFERHITRELTKTSVSLTLRYVMSPVPNSASNYLINRKGKVVHEDDSICMNDICKVKIRTTKPLMFDSYRENDQLEVLFW